MAYRQVGQPSFADALASRRGTGNPVLRRIRELVDWTAVERVLGDLPEPERGPPPYPRLVMFKALLVLVGISRVAPYNETQPRIMVDAPLVRNTSCLYLVSRHPLTMMSV